MLVRVLARRFLACSSLSVGYLQHQRFRRVFADSVGFCATGGDCQRGFSR